MMEKVTTTTTQTQVQNLPEFYTNELRITHSEYLFWLLCTFFGILLSIICTITFAASLKPYGIYIILFFIPLCFVLIACFNNKRQTYYWLKKESKSIVFSESEKTSSINIKKLYKKLRVSYIKVNWNCLTLYVLYIFGFFVWSIVCLFSKFDNSFDNIAINNFGDFFNNIGKMFVDFGHGLEHGMKTMISPTGGVFFAVFLFLIVLFILTIGYHVYAINKSSSRVNSIDNYYGEKELVAEGEIEQLKKKTFWFGFFTFAIVTVILLCISFSLWKKYKSNPNTGYVPPTRGII